MSISNTPVSDPNANQTGEDVSKGSDNIPFPAISNEKHSGVVNNIAAGNINSASLMMPSETLDPAAVQGNDNNNHNNHYNHNNHNHNHHNNHNHYNHYNHYNHHCHYHHC